MTKSVFPCIWFDGKAKEAANFYCGIFPDSEILSDGGMVVNFRLGDTAFMGLNGGPQFKPNEAVSSVITCADQAEIDRYWYKLIADGGAEGQCGWCKDKYGVSWQVIPSTLGALMSNPEKQGRAVAAFMTMKKIDIQTLQNV